MNASDYKQEVLVVVSNLGGGSVLDIVGINRFDK